MLRDSLLRQHQPRIRALARQHGIASVRVFGSRARGEATPESDVDLLIERDETPAPFFFPGGFIADLEALLGARVEVVTEAALHPALRARVLEEAVAL